MNDLRSELEDRYHIVAHSAPTARVLKHGDTFAVLDRSGDIGPLGTEDAAGVYHEGTRYLSRLRTRIGREWPLLLSSTVRESDLLLAVDLMNPDVLDGEEPLVAHGALHVFREMFLWDGALYQHLQLSSYEAAHVRIGLTIDLAADFADLFEVRGNTRQKRGELDEPQCGSGEIVLGYRGLDGKHRRTRVRFAPAPRECSATRASFEIELDAKQTKDMYVTVICESDDAPPPSRARSLIAPAFENARGEAMAAQRKAAEGDCQIQTSNDQVNAWLSRSLSDLRMLLTDTDGGPYPYAGVPWYATPFGRDGILTALQALWLNPDIARGVLEFLAATQADQVDPEADAEPGKIVHEMRKGEMAALREVPFGRYYGTVDATPLFIVLADAYYDATGDLAFTERMWSHVERALQWIDEYGDADGDGFVEYSRKSSTGLVQQGWKDSFDSVFHADGTLAEGPIALCEVQGYVHAARLGAARMARALGHAARAEQLEARAHALAEQLDRFFWCDDLGTYALALDGHKRPCRVRSSNAGHCLFTRSVPTEHARRVAEQLMSESSFSGWGVRTLASDERRYNPMSYHNGTIWPHDNALIALGLAHYGLIDQACTLFESFFHASTYLELNRLPELFCGFARRTGEGPTLYPVACAPQAWAAAAPLAFLSAVLGFRIDGVHQRISFAHTRLPRFLDRVQIDNLRVGSARVDLRLTRHETDAHLDVLDRRGELEVVVVK